MESDALRSRLDLANQRWELLCQEVGDAQKRRDQAGEAMEDTDFTNDMDDLFSWIDETENMIGGTLR